ncbi:hypothetical protein HA466_0035780 [Hirschfeldia incana]|nr:hypothetical protein HA466_0035780 [Hirschfeldia incana]
MTKIHGGNFSASHPTNAWKSSLVGTRDRHANQNRIDQKSTRCEEKSGTGDDLGGQYTEKLPILTKLPSSCRLGRIPAAILARDVVYSTSSSTMITTEIMIDR